jgi:hypothetical protein
VSADYSLRKFPFDTQTLEFQIEPFMPAAQEFIFASQPANPTGHDSAADAGLAAWEIKGLNYKTRQAKAKAACPPAPRRCSRW